jgi:hypothetical protein
MKVINILQKHGTILPKGSYEKTLCSSRSTKRFTDRMHRVVSSQ